MDAFIEKYRRQMLQIACDHGAKSFFETFHSQDVVIRNLEIVGEATK
jgi:uncharacterized protein with HEPN domain